MNTKAKHMRDRISKIEKQVCTMFKRGDESVRFPFNELMRFLSMHGEHPSDGEDFFKKVAQLIVKMEDEVRTQKNIDPHMLYLQMLERGRKVYF